jgi:glucosyl-3-phosphoglycerate synthase
MSDFYQHGMITTLQKLRERPAGELNEELMAIARRRKIVLLLPALISEFDTPSMPVILEELKKVTFLHRIVLSLDRANEADFDVSGVCSPTCRRKSASSGTTARA